MVEQEIIQISRRKEYVGVRVTPNSHHFGHIEEYLQTSNRGYHKDPKLETISDNKYAKTKCGKTH